MDLVGDIDMFAKLALALVLGAVLGFERVTAGKEAGMRTFGLVSVGSCLFIIIGETIVGRYAEGQIFDPLRVASAIISGIGFIGAGLIIFQHELKGLTTAAVLWVASGIGVAVGFGLYTLAVFTTSLALFVLVGLWFIERTLERLVGKRSRGRFLSGH